MVTGGVTPRLCYQRQCLINSTSSATKYLRPMIMQLSVVKTTRARMVKLRGSAKARFTAAGSVSWRVRWRDQTCLPSCLPGCLSESYANGLWCTQSDPETLCA